MEAARLLLERGADVNAKELARADRARCGPPREAQPAMVKLLDRARRGRRCALRGVTIGRDRCTGEPRRMYRPFGGLTPLLYAAREGCLECARALVEAGANLDLPGTENITPLFLALDNFHFDLAKYLIEQGANVNKWDWWGRTPLYSAVDLNTLPHGGRPDRLSTDETTSARHHRQLLLDKGANPNVQLKLGVAPYRHIGDDRGCDACSRPAPRRCCARRRPSTRPRCSS